MMTSGVPPLVAVSNRHIGSLTPAVFRAFRAPSECHALIEAPRSGRTCSCISDSCCRAVKLHVMSFDQGQSKLYLHIYMYTSMHQQKMCIYLCIHIHICVYDFRVG